MRTGSTTILRGVIYCSGIAVLALCIFVLPRLIAAEVRGDFDYGIIFIGMYVAAIPFFIGLYHALKLLSAIAAKKAFSRLSITSLASIKFCGLAISGVYALLLPHIFQLAQEDDAPGVALIGLILTFAPLVIGIFAAVLQKFFQDAMHIKNENDLTI